MNRRLLFPLACLMLIAGCNRAAEDKTAVRSGLMEHLSKNSGLDLKSMDVDITSLRFEGGEALATVAFRPKDNPSSGMTMNYTLERKGNQWAVKGKADSTGGTTGSGQSGGMQVEPGGALPPAHPPVGGSSEKSGELPAGHPPVSSPDSSTK